MSKSDADARTGGRDLWDAVLPPTLEGPARHQEIAPTQLEGARPAAAAAGAGEEPARISQRHQGHDRLGDLAGDPVAVPGHAVAPVAIEVEAHRVQGHAVARRQHLSHALEDGRLERPTRREAPPGREPRLGDAPF